MDIPVITSATYDAATGTLVVTGTDFPAKSGGQPNDIVASKFTFTGEGGETYTLNNSADVEITSSTAFTLILSDTDRAAVNLIINKNGASSTNGTTYNLAAAEDWAAGAPKNDVIADSATGINVSNVAIPTIASVTYDINAGILTVIGTGFLTLHGPTNDIDVSKFRFTGEGGSTYTLLNSTDVDLTSGTTFTVTLSALDKAAVNLIINNAGTSSTGGTTYNLAAAEDWAAGADTAVTVADTTTGITAVSPVVPTITSAAYNASTGILAVTGTGFVSKSGNNNDIAISLLTITGEGNATHTLSSGNIDITSSTAFSITLNSTDQAAVNQIINKNGTSSTGGAIYNLAAAEDWALGAIATLTIADTTGNGVDASNIAVPAITSASYDASTGSLTVTGTGFLKLNGAANDIVATKLTFTGEGGNSHTLTNSANVDITNGTAFTMLLSATDKAAVNQIINKDGASSTGSTPYNLAANEDWAAGADAAINVADTTNTLSASNTAIPTITSATYNASTGALTVTGANFLSKNGTANDIVASKFTFTGEGNTPYTLTSSADVDITDGTTFTILLSATDKAAVNQIINKNGTSSTSGTTYNLAAAEDWAAGASAAINIADLTGNGITTNNVAAPAISTATYDGSSGVLTVTGTGFLSKTGAANDIDVSKFTFTGQGGGTYALTDSSDVDITSGTTFTVTLSVTDKTAVNLLINNNGAISTDNTPYNLAADEDWAVGADPAVTVADANNSITAINATIPTITSATYDTSTGSLVVTGAGFVSVSGNNNDIIATKFTFTGEGGETYALTNSSNADITSGEQC